MARGVEIWYDLFGFFCFVLSVVLLTAGLCVLPWLTACFPLITLIYDSIGDIAIMHLYGLTRGSKFANTLKRMLEKVNTSEQFQEQQRVKNEDFDEFRRIVEKQMCISQTLTQYCIHGDSVFGVGDYRLCIDTKVLSPFEILTAAILKVSICACAISAVLLLFGILKQRTRFRVTSRVNQCIGFVAAATAFITGCVLMITVSPLVKDSAKYSADTTLYFNEVLSKLIPDYEPNFKVNWKIHARDVSELQGLTRRIVETIQKVACGSAFYCVTVSTIILFVAFCCLALKSRDNNPNELVTRPEIKEC